MAKGSLFDLWFWPVEAARTAASAMQTVTDAVAVINARTPLIHATFANPFEADTVELSRMITEKWDAFGRSGNTLSVGHRSVQNAVLANARDFGRLAGGHPFGPEQWIRIAEQNLAIWSTLTMLPGATLQPIRARAASNARRLTTPMSIR